MQFRLYVAFIKFDIIQNLSYHFSTFFIFFFLFDCSTHGDSCYNGNIYSTAPGDLNAGRLLFAALQEATNSNAELREDTCWHAARGDANDVVRNWFWFRRLAN